MEIVTEMKTVKITKEQIDEVFEKCVIAGNYTVELHKLVFPNWDKIEKLTDFPKTSKEVGSYIFQKAVEFDRKYYPGCIPAGQWLNRGFSTYNSDVEGWKVRQCPYILKSEE